MKIAGKKCLQALALASLLALPSACASVPAAPVGGSATAANIRAQSQADDVWPVSAKRMGLAIRRYQQNKSLPPASMRTTDSVDPGDGAKGSGDGGAKLQ